MLIAQWGRRFMAVGLLAVSALASRAADFTVASVTGDAQAKRPGLSYAPVKSGDRFGSGAVLRTGGDARVTAQFDAQNGFVVLPDTTVRVDGGAAAIQAGVRLALDNGRVESTLAAWPAAAAYEVASAAGAFMARGTTFTTGYKLGTIGQFIGDVTVGTGEVEFLAAECDVPAVTANGGLNVTRTVGLESTLLEITAVGNGITVVVGERHRISVAAGTTVRIGVAQRYMKRFAAVWVQNGSVTVGDKTITPADGALFIVANRVLPNGGGLAFMEAVRVESSAYAQSLLPGLTDAELAALRATQRSGARAVLDSAVGAGVLPMYQPPFVPERPISAALSPSGTP
jgi:hypothetical protein